jgi:hypothetical protein
MSASAQDEEECALSPDRVRGASRDRVRAMIRVGSIVREKRMRLETRTLALALPLFLIGCGTSSTTQPPIVGAWRSSIQFQSGAFAYGEWRKINANEFEAKYEFYSTAPSPPDAFKTGAGWVPAGRGVLTERIQVSKDGDAFTSTIRYDAFDKTGKPAEGGGTATGRGSRMGS